MAFKLSLLRLPVLIAALAIAPAAATALPILADNITLSHDSVVTVTFEGYSAAYTSQLFLDTPSNTLGSLFTNKTASVGSSIVLGNFAAGTELIFRLFVENTNKSYFTGAASRNLDQVAHAAVETVGSKRMVGFEDLWGGGDRDYNDFMFSVSVQRVPDHAATGLLFALGLVTLAIARRRLG